MLTKVISILYDPIAMKDFIRAKLYSKLSESLDGNVYLIQAIVGPRQVGKTTLVLQLFDRWKGPKLYDSADQPNTPSYQWIESCWNKIRQESASSKRPAILIIDEIQKIPHWSEIIKKLYDEDRRNKRKIHVIILGSSALLMQRGLSESLAGRFELHRHFQWSYQECRACFSLSLNEYLYFGGYPGALALRKDEKRWANYIRDSLIETVLAKDIFLLAAITKPILLRQTFGLAAQYPAQIISYQKMLGSLQDAGNSTTIASYLQLLAKAFLVAPLERWSGSRIRQRGSTPKLVLLDNSLITAMENSDYNRSIREKQTWGRLVENAVGSRLYFFAQQNGGELYYWRERELEIDYILKIGKKITCIEVKSGDFQINMPALKVFIDRYQNSKAVVISHSKNQSNNFIKNINLKTFFQHPEKIL